MTPAMWLLVGAGLFYVVTIGLGAYAFWKNKPKPVVGCTWQEGGDTRWGWTNFYHTDCGHKFQFTNGGPSRYEFITCPYCGKPLEEKS